MTFVYFAVEGDSDVPVAERLSRHVGLLPDRAIVAGDKYSGWLVCSYDDAFGAITGHVARPCPRSASGVMRPELCLT